MGVWSSGNNDSALANAMGYRIPPRSLLAGKHENLKSRSIVTIIGNCRRCSIPSWTAVRTWFANLFKYEADHEHQTGSKHENADSNADVMLTDEIGNLEKKGVLSSPDHHHQQQPHGKESEGDAWMVHPFSPFRRMWDIMTMLMLLYISILIPFRIAFAVRDQLVWMITDRAVDFFFVADIVLNFFTGAIVDGKVIMKRSEVASMYLRSWFIVDVIAAIPFDFITEVIMTGTITSDGHAEYYLRSTKLLRFARLAKFMRLIRLIKVVRMSPMVNQLKANVHMRRSITHAVLFLVLVLFVAHWSGCIMFLISSLSAEDCDRYMSPDCELRPPMVIKFMLWGSDDISTGTQYLNMFYWAVGTMCTIGYGDLVPISDKEKVFALVVIFMGTSIVAYGIADMCNVIINLNQHESNFTKLLDSMNDYMDYRCLPKAMRWRVRQYLIYKKQGSLVAWHNESLLQSELSPSLRSEINAFIYKNVVEEIDLFSTVGPAFKAAVCQRMRGAPYAPGDVIIKEGDMGAEMFIICRGSVELRKQDGLFDPRCSPAGYGTLLRTLHEGQVFGEISVFFPGRRMVTARAVTYCDMCFLRKADMDELLVEFPESSEELRQAALDRISRDGIKAATVFESAMSGLRRPAGSSPQSLATATDALSNSEGDGGVGGGRCATMDGSGSLGTNKATAVVNWLQHFSPKGAASAKAQFEDGAGAGLSMVSGFGGSLINPLGGSMANGFGGNGGGGGGGSNTGSMLGGPTAIWVNSAHVRDEYNLGYRLNGPPGSHSPSSDEVGPPLLPHGHGGDVGGNNKIRKLPKVSSVGGHLDHSHHTAVGTFMGGRQVSADSLPSPHMSEQSHSETAQLLASDQDLVSSSCAPSPSHMGPCPVVTEGMSNVSHAGSNGHVGGSNGYVGGSNNVGHGAGSQGVPHLGGFSGISLKRMMSRSRVAPEPLLEDGTVPSSGDGPGVDAPQRMLTSVRSFRGARAPVLDGLAGTVEAELLGLQHVNHELENQVVSERRGRMSLEIEAATAISALRWELKAKDEELKMAKDGRKLGS